MNEDALFQKFWHEYRQQRQKEMRYELMRLSWGMPHAERLRTLRRALSLTQRQLARELGVSVRTIIRQERGQCIHGWSAWAKQRRFEEEHVEELVAYLAGCATSGNERGGTVSASSLCAP